ncbi:MAG: amidohydrolase [Spirochaetaceae bacterium]|jgi:predicted TIM-barrel fold metal-dependent hydrolase|nr:amidohydrolase [Spirochaetaceae bacterium]
MEKIDFHIHVTPPEICRNVEKYARREPYFGLLSASPSNRFASCEEAVAELDRAGFAQAVVFGFGFRDMGLCRMVNDYVIAKTREYPERLIGFTVVPPAHPESAREIARCADAGLRGVGEVFPAGQGFSLEDPADTRVFAGCCVERGLPVLIHANEPVGHYYPGKTPTTLGELERFVGRNPDLTIILAHWGGGFLWYEMMPEVKKKCRNLYYDTAASVFLYDERIYKVACAAGITERILFGSDFPLVSLSRYLDGIARSGVSEEAQSLILGGNAARLFSPQPPAV